MTGHPKNSAQPQAERPQRVRVHQPSWAQEARYERQAVDLVMSAPRLVCPNLLPGYQENFDPTLEDLRQGLEHSRIPYLFKFARYLAVGRMIVGVVAGGLHVTFIVMERTKPQFFGYSIFALAFGLLHLHTFEFRHEMRSATDPRPSKWYLARLAFYTAGWTSVFVIAMIIAITAGDSLGRETETLEKRRIRIKTIGVTGLNLPVFVKYILYTAIVLAFLCWVACCWIWVNVYRLHATDFSQEEIAQAPYVYWKDDKFKARALLLERERDEALAATANQEMRERGD